MSAAERIARLRDRTGKLLGPYEVPNPDVVHPAQVQHTDTFKPPRLDGQPGYQQMRRCGFAVMDDLSIKRVPWLDEFWRVKGKEGLFVGVLNLGDTGNGLPIEVRMQRNPDGTMEKEQATITAILPDGRTETRVCTYDAKTGLVNGCTPAEAFKTDVASMVKELLPQLHASCDDLVKNPRREIRTTPGGSREGLEFLDMHRKTFRTELGLK